MVELIVVLFILGLLIAAVLLTFNRARHAAPHDEARALGQEWRTLEGATNAYTFATGTVTRCAPGNRKTKVAGQKYYMVPTVIGTGAGSGYDVFPRGSTCP